MALLFVYTANKQTKKNTVVEQFSLERWMFFNMRPDWIYMHGVKLGFGTHSLFALRPCIRLCFSCHPIERMRKMRTGDQRRSYKIKIVSKYNTEIKLI